MAKNALQIVVSQAVSDNPLLQSHATGLPQGRLAYSEDLIHALPLPAAGGGSLPIYRGQMRGKEPSGNFFSEDHEFAKQFTRQGLDEEVITRHIAPEAIYHPPQPVYAGDEAAVDEAIAEAKRQGRSAVRLSEARGRAPGEEEPASLFVFDKSALFRDPLPDR